MMEGKTKKGKKGKSKGKQKLPSVTSQEGLLAYQITNKERQLEDVMYEIKLLEDQNSKRKERNEALRAEQQIIIADMLKSSLGKSRASEERVEVVTKEQVADAVYKNYDLHQRHIKDLSVVQQQIASKEQDILQSLQELNDWTDYKDRRMDEEKRHINQLQHEISDIEEQFNYMSEMLETTLRNSNVETEAVVNRQLDQQRYLATRNVVAGMDKHSRQEVVDHDWLTTENARHQGEVDALEEEMRELEEENLELMSRLQRYHAESIFLSKKEIEDQIEVGSIEDSSDSCCAIDLSKIDFNNKRGLGTFEPLSKRSVMKAIQQKLALVSLQTMQMSGNAKHSGDAFITTSNKKSSDFHLPPLNVQRDRNFGQVTDHGESKEKYLQLGSLEQRLLGVRGEKVNLHTPQGLDEEELTQPIKGKDWPVTHSMIVERLARAGIE